MKIVFLHGLGQDEQSWKDVISYLPNSYSCKSLSLFGMATVFLTNFIRCRTSFRMLFRLSLTMSLLGCDDLRQELTVKVRLPR
ncbi:hypothetical protein OGQ_02001 [Enterococcus faecium EnGen0017]|nr:hypothetical protein OGQ_02001 [Enterococcus faecium EnGen0017]